MKNNCFKVKMMNIFIVIFIITLLFHIFLLIFQKGRQFDLYFLNMNDFFADFLNAVRFSAGRDPYFDETIHPMHHNQGGLWYIFCWCVKRMAGIEPGASLPDLWNNHAVMLITFYYLGVLYLLIGHSLICLCRKFNTSRLILIPLMMSYPMLHSIERANHVMFTAACIIYFISFYDSDNQRLKLFSCLCLALAASQKIYPVLFGFLFFEKKQYKEILVSALMTVVLFFVPFLFFKHGLQNFPRLLWNVKQFSSIEAHSSFMLFVRVVCLFSLILSLFQKSLFNRLICIIFPLLLLSTNAGFYTTLYLYPLVVLLFNKNNSKEDRCSIRPFETYFFFVYFICLLMPLQICKYLFNTEGNDNLIIYYQTLKYIFLGVFAYETIYTIKSVVSKPIKFS